MGFFVAFRKQTPTEQLRKEVAKYFNKIAEDAIRDAAGDPFMAGMMIEMSIGKLYQELEQNYQLASICANEGIVGRRAPTSKKKISEKRVIAGVRGQTSICHGLLFFQAYIYSVSSQSLLSSLDENRGRKAFYGRL